MTERELELEFAYRVQERLGMICGNGPSSVDDVARAEREAEEAIAELRKQDE